MNDTRIMFRDGILGMSVTVDEMNAMLQQHGLHIAPLPAPAPPPQTEAERLVGIAQSLPAEAWEDSGWENPYVGAMGHTCIFFDHSDGVRSAFLATHAFRTILLGVMAAYVGTDIRTGVQRVGEHDCAWWNGGRSGIAPDLLTAYAACCKAISERRKGVA